MGELRVIVREHEAGLWKEPKNGEEHGWSRWELSFDPNSTQ